MFSDINMDKVIISTGNILSVNKKAGQKAEDEVIHIKHQSFSNFYYFKNEECDHTKKSSAIMCD